MRFGPETFPNCRVWLTPFARNVTGSNVNNIPNLGTLRGYFSQVGAARPTYDRPQDSQNGNRYWPTALKYTRASSQFLRYSGAASDFNWAITGPSTWVGMIAPTTGVPASGSLAVILQIGNGATQTRFIYLDNRPAIPATLAWASSIVGAATLATVIANNFQYAASTGKARYFTELCEGASRDRLYYAGALQQQSGAYAYPAGPCAAVPTLGGGSIGFYFDGHIGFFAGFQGILPSASQVFLRANMRGLFGNNSIQ